MEEVILQKSKLKAVKIFIGEYKGTKYLQISDMWRETEAQEWLFSKKNVTINGRIVEDFTKIISDKAYEIIEAITVKEDQSED